MVGVFIDDRRNPKERDSIVADHGFVVKNPQGTFIILEDGTLQRFETGKQELGMGDYEVRSWRGWHHHLTLVIVALAFLVRVQDRLKKTRRP